MEKTVKHTNEIDVGKLPSIGMKLERVSEGCVRLVSYKKQEDGKDLLTVRQSSIGFGRYELQVNVPEMREVNELIVIVKSSANKFRVCYSSPKSTVFDVFTGYDELRRWLLDFVQVPMKLDTLKAGKSAG